MTARDVVHVEADEALRPLRRGLEDALAAGPAVGQGGFLGDRIDAVRGADQGGAVAGDEAAQDRAARLHQLGRDDDVHIARQRHQGEDRFGPVGHSLARKELDIINGRAGALGDARDGRALGDVAVAPPDFGDPVRQNAAALAAQGEDRDGDALALHIRHPLVP